MGRNSGSSSTYSLMIFASRDVDDRLPGLGKPVRLLGVGDGPRLVEAGDQRAVFAGGTAFLVIAAQTEVAVGDSEQGLGPGQVRL